MINLSEKKPAKVLVVDDDEMIRFLIRETLQESHFHVDEVESGEAAIEYFLQTPPDIVLLDVIMQGMDGFEVCAQLRKQAGGKHVPIVMMTGLDDIDSIHHAYNSGATDFTTKPINYTILAHRLRYMLRAGQLFERLRRNETRLSKAQQIARLGYWEWNTSQNRLHIPSQTLAILGLEPTTHFTSLRQLLHFIPLEERPLLRKTFFKALRTNQDFAIEHEIITPNKQVKSIRQEGELQQKDNGQKQWIVTIQDISERKKSEEKIIRLAYYDNLTTLPNRVFLQEYLNKLIEQAKRHHRLFAILSLDLDHFKRINNTWGQGVGNLLLQEAARRLNQCVRTSDYLVRGNWALPTDAYAQSITKNDTLVRLGGDEFILLLSDIKDLTGVQHAIRRIHKILNAPFILKKERFYLTASIGISMFPNDGQTTDVLLAHAEMAMQHAKNAGRNTFEFFHPSMNVQAHQRLMLENELRKALENEELEVYYQPKVELKQNKTIGMEALVRWQHPEKGMISPATFIPLAEETDLIYSLGEWVLRRACKDTKQWNNAGYPLKVAVNLSVLQFKNTELLNTVRNALEDSGLGAQYLELEITEGVLLEDSDNSKTILSKLKNMGLKIALDDFGTGYSSLSYLKKFPFDTLKIDQSFVRDVGTDQDSSALASAIIALSKCLNLKVVAEGVETSVQLEFMKKHQCNEIQGYFFSAPLSRQKFDAWLKSH
ncbi:EAL domain-containing protein [Candidatus Venteria ishoeyi]|uniref:two-component system response regulator n=1 Tax=Candidatus Venteria ishoeyi TaxID=1899563 RepID=UPI0025A4E97B|nr:EAL domain-containing protein [Candidatus Venteria ishoeyi]MDM8545270.1 EAL domain-containing protein [Candidatus Venteria ishoeyi]